jgi:hypothetical protein
MNWIDDFVACIERATLEKQTIEEAILIKQDHLPTRIYKYRRGDDNRAVSNLQNDLVWMASPDTYNDPYDCSFKVAEEQAVEEFLKTAHGRFIARDVQFGEQKIAQYISNAVESLRNFRRTTKICSFSAADDSLLMWGHYAGDHKGFCIGYDLEPLPANDPIRRNLYPVMYSKDLYDMTEYVNGTVTAERKDFSPLLPLLSVLRKFDGWQYEQEWRLIRFNQWPKPDQTQQMPKAKRVILGSKIAEPRAKEIAAICAERAIEVRIMSLSPDKFELIAKPFVPAA